MLLTSLPLSYGVAVLFMFPMTASLLVVTLHHLFTKR